MPTLSDPLLIRGNRLKNRLVMPPMVPFSLKGDNGEYYGRQHVEHYADRARGGAAMIIVQATSVFGAASSTEEWTLGSQDALREIACHCRAHDVIAVMQLSCDDLDVNTLFGRQLTAMQSEMRHAAVRAHELGFHGVEFHCAHGYTLCRFLDAAHNRRRDAFGGTVENRLRIVTDVLPEIRAETPDAFFVGVRMGEYQPGTEDGLEAARVFDAAGVDFFDISYGMEPPPDVLPFPGYPASATTYSAYRIKQATDKPVIAVTEIRDGRTARYLVGEGYADLAAVGRGMLADAEFANHVLSNRPVRRCRGCRECFWFTDHTRCRGGNDSDDTTSGKDDHIIYGKSFGSGQ